jgi:sugar phosphate isomerase/epimerase
MPMNAAFQSLPFKIGATSMVFGHDMVENAGLLARIVNHVEILLFHTPTLDNIPGTETIRRLNEIRRANSITYSVHLPASLEVGAAERQRRTDAARLAAEICLQMADLDPICYVLHIPFSPPTLVAVPGVYFGSGTKDLQPRNPWARRSLESLAVVRESVPKSAELLVENINYSPSFLMPFVESGLCGLCLDIGHLILGGECIEDALTAHLDATREIHLHGVKGCDEHLCLSELPEPMLNHCVAYLKKQRFSGVVNLEVFTSEHLERSLEVLLKTIRAAGGDGGPCGV